MEGIRKQKIYYNIKKGYMVRRAMPGDEPGNMITRIVENGMNVDEVHINWLEGRSNSIYTIGRAYKDKPYRVLCLELMNEDGDICVIQTDLRTNAATDIILRWENIDHSQPWTILTGYKKDRLFAWIEQGPADKEGRRPKVKKLYTKDDPRDKPQWRQIEKDGVQVWDRTAELRWLELKLLEFDSALRSTPSV